MPGLWKEWKAKSRLPTLSTSPLEISPTAGEIPTFPQLRRRRRMETCKTQSRFFTFPTATDSLSLKAKKQGRGTGFALRSAAGEARPPPQQKQKDDPYG